MHTDRSRLHLAPLPWVVGLLLVSLLGCREEPAPLTVRITQPAAAVHTREASLSLQVAVEGGAADRVELLRDGEPLADVVAPYEYTWDLSSVSEGTYALTARAWLDGDSYTSEPLSVRVDRTGPWVVSSLPGDGAVDVQALAPITLEFSEPMHPDSLQPEGIELVSGNRPVPFTAELTADGHTLTLTPRVETWHGRYSHVRLHQARDLAGNPMRELGEALIDWTRAEWQTLPNLAGPEEDSAFAIHADATGVPLVAQHQLTDGQRFVVVKRWSGRTWEPVGAPIRIFSNSPPTQLSLASSPEGHPWVAWSATQSQGDSEVHAQAWTGSAWQSLGATPEQPGLRSTFNGPLSLRVSPQGTGYLAYRSLSGVHLRRWSGTDWEDLPLPPVASLKNIDLELGPAGPVVALAGTHAGHDGTHVSVWRWLDGDWQALGSPFNLGSTSLGPDVLMLELDASGRPVVGYIGQHPHGVTMFLWVHVWNGEDWPMVGQHPPMLGSFGSTYPRWPSLTLDRTGAPWAAYTYQTGGWPNPTYATTDVFRWDGTAWTRTATAYLGVDARRPAQLTRVSADAMFAVGRSPQDVRASIRLETH